ncbi:Vegetative incompatibility protein HET-E-1 [Cladobotryum mycophilum]|uniref:Vegetative incompatibility protein HET-E-1 n=1 Tax=Cladobotryum mycophilum TaxID=491253 RepID=A0ABR0SIP1_9HYPO
MGNRHSSGKWWKKFKGSSRLSRTQRNSHDIDTTSPGNLLQGITDDDTNESSSTAAAAPPVTGNRVEDAAEDMVNNGSLWDRAYNGLKDCEPDLITEYEKLLSRVLGVQATKPTTPTEIEDTNEVENQIPAHDVIARQKKLKIITELGLEHVKNKEVNVTLLGHDINLENVMANVAGVVEWAEDYVKDAIKDLPYAPIVMAGVSLILPLLKNPVAAKEANREGFTYVTSRIRYYGEMESLLLPQYMKAGVTTNLTKDVIELYELIISFQVHSVIRFYRSGTKNFFRGAVNYDDWANKVKDIKNREKELGLKFHEVMNATSLQKLEKLAQNADESREKLDAILNEIKELTHIAREGLSLAQRMDRYLSNTEGRVCIEVLRATNPLDDKTRIEKDKGGLLEGSCSWVINDTAFQKLRGDSSNAQVRLLWIRGDPGKGKTMLVCGIIDKLNESIEHTDNIAFFFFQEVDDRINNATAVLRGLISMLIKQRPSLISYVQKRYDDDGKKCFEGPNAWVALSKTFTNICNDPNLQNTYLLIDALDECTTDLDKLLDLIVEKALRYSRIRWILSSRNWPDIEKRLHEATQQVQLHLELNEESVSASITRYVQSNVESLAKRNEYDHGTREAVQQFLLLNANGTFLWVAILAVVSVVHRPISLSELETLVEMPPRSSGNDKALKEIVGHCGSFLTLQERTVSFVHQSAKDFLLKKACHEIFPSGQEKVHHDIFSRSLRALYATLRRDIYSLGAPGYHIDQVRQPDPDPLVAVRYSCVYWIDHLHACSPSENTKDDLKEGGLIYEFLRHHFLHWLEALSLLHGISKGILSIARLRDLLGEQIPESQVLSLVQDAMRFIFRHGWVIKHTPLQAYVSALIFSPEQSKLQTICKDEEPPWILSKPVIEVDWDACLQTLEGHNNSVNSVVFSPDGQRLASGSGDNTVKIWDTNSGACLQTLEGHNNSVKSVMFSLDGQRLASGSDDSTVKIWDTNSGACLQTIYIGQSIKYLKFDLIDNSRLTTEFGVLRIDMSVTEISAEMSSRDVDICGYGISSDGTWITKENLPLVWLPPEYRSRVSAVFGTTVAIGCVSNRVLVMRFS